MALAQEAGRGSWIDCVGLGKVGLRSLALNRP